MLAPEFLLASSIYVQRSSKKASLARRQLVVPVAIA